VNRFADAGSLVLGASVDPKKAIETAQVMLAELERAREPIPEAELVKARDYIKGRLQLRMEDTGAVASWLGRQELLRKQIMTVDDVLAIIESVTVEDLKRVADDLVRPELLNLAVVGPYRSAARFEAVIR
jgi:predicted Zn-dependent peptidase